MAHHIAHGFTEHNSSTVRRDNFDLYRHKDFSAKFGNKADKTCRKLALLHTGGVKLMTRVTNRTRLWTVFGFETKCSGYLSRVHWRQKQETYGQ